MFDCTAFLRRKGWRQKDLAERLNIRTSTVGMWCIGSSTPSYEVIRQLFMLGITPRELFGECIDDILKRQYLPEGSAGMEFLEGKVNPDDPGFSDAIEKIVLEMKAEGKI